jgi:hypothetical protein
MSKLWVFGDSFTAGNGCLANEEYPLKYRLTSDHLIWPEILAKNLKLKLINRGMGLYSNDKIVDTIMEDYYSIEKGDFVIVGKTFPSRFDVPTKNRETLMTISPINLDPATLAYFNAGYNKQEVDYLWQMVELMDDPMLTKRQDFRFDFLKSILFEHRKVRSCVIWDVDKIWNSFETINDATKGEVFDHHWSYQGHRDFTSYITEYVEKKEDIIKPVKKLI